MKRLTFIAPAVLAGLLCSTASALQITPMYQMFTLEPGQTADAQLTIINDEPADLEVTAEAKDWFTAPAHKNIKTADWLTIDGKPFLLKKGESKTIPFSVKRPKKTQGEVMGMLSFTTKGSHLQSVQLRVSVAIYAAIKGTEKVKGEVVAISVAPSTGMVQVGVIVLNTGNVHIRPAGLFQILNDKDQVYANIEIDKGSPAYPGKTRTYFGKIGGFTLPPGRYSAVINLTDTDRNVALAPARKKFILTPEGKVELK